MLLGMYPSTSGQWASHPRWRAAVSTWDFLDGATSSDLS